ncbi:hypothetical protein U0070_022277 [Myodes glareolus]|uniref:Uncharacterized protein n=1 Tax=Myodes glareolus TaxID=447135 RepID=A0AAW0HGV1_MYOGA
MEPGRGGGQTGLPGRASLPGALRRPMERQLYWRDDAFTSGDAPRRPSLVMRNSKERAQLQIESLRNLSSSLLL